MALTLEDITEEVPKCPKCGHAGYVVVPKLKVRKPALESVTCSKCKTDILEAYWAMKGRLT
jgi:hypothetical protein